MPARARSEPTDRSIPAVRMTKVMPTAISPVNDTWRRVFSRLNGFRKFGSKAANTTTSTSRNNGAASLDAM